MELCVFSPVWRVGGAWGELCSQGLWWFPLGQVGAPGLRACSESALVPRDPSPSAEASPPMASTTPSWPQWRRAPA